MQTKSRKYRYAAPSDWLQIDLHAAPQDEADRIHAEFYGGRNRDSGAVSRHWLRERVKEIVDEVSTGDHAVKLDTLLMPVPDSEVAALPLTLVIGTMDPPPFEGTVTQVLVAVAASDPTAVPVEVAEGLALRTVRTRDARKPLMEIAENEPSMTPEQVGQLDEELPDELVSQRFSYIIGREEPRTWLFMSLSCMVPVTDPANELTEAYQELADAIVSTISWESSDE